MKVYTFSMVIGSMLASACGSSSSDTATTATETSVLTVNAGSSLSLTGVDTKVAKMKVYEFLVAKESDCSSPISVFASADGKEVDMNIGPEIGSGDLEQGTYNCVIMVMSDTMKFIPKTTTGVCEADTEYPLDVFRPQGETYKPEGVLPDGTAITGVVDEQKIAVYISTLSTSEGGEEGNNPFEAPTADKLTNGIKLTAPLVVTADTVGTMVMDTSGRVESNYGTCDMQPPQFGFK